MKNTAVLWLVSSRHASHALSHCPIEPYDSIVFVGNSLYDIDIYSHLQKVIPKNLNIIPPSTKLASGQSVPVYLATHREFTCSQLQKFTIKLDALLELCTAHEKIISI